MYNNKTGALFLKILFVFSALLVWGCSASLVQPRTDTQSTRDQLSWNSYEEAEARFKNIVAGQTTLAELKRLDFDPRKVPNTKRILDVRKELLPHPSLSVESLKPGARLCYELGSPECIGYQFRRKATKSKGVGNDLLYILKFKSERETDGWEIELDVYLVPKDGVKSGPSGELSLKDEDLVVVHGLFGGTSHIKGFKKKVNPLGPLQMVIDAGSSVSGIKAPRLGDDDE